MVSCPNLAFWPIKSGAHCTICCVQPAMPGERCVMELFEYAISHVGSVIIVCNVRYAQSFRWVSCYSIEKRIGRIYVKTCYIDARFLPFLVTFLSNVWLIVFCNATTFLNTFGRFLPLVSKLAVTLVGLPYRFSFVIVDGFKVCVYVLEFVTLTVIVGRYFYRTRRA